jgi:hypothetical protein
MDIYWDGTTKAEPLKKYYADLGIGLADAAKNYNWQIVILMI